ncbi:MAG: hypothetical protein J6U54_22150 [Clostridiales bacterium]|nr:hypothetical protein [Clostridiales bacterium]
MFKIEKKSLVNLICGLIFFLIGGFIQARELNFRFIVASYYAILSIFWAVGIRQKIVRSATKNLFVGITVTTVVVMFLRMTKYKFMNEYEDFKMLAWYINNFPMMLLASFSFLAALSIEIHKDIFRKFTIVVLSITAILGVFFITNDLHHLCYRFTGPNWEDDYQRGIIFWISFIWQVLLLLSSFVLVLRKCRVSTVRKLSWIPFLVLLVGAGLLLQSNIGLFKYMFYEIACFTVIGFWEACILIGLIPSCDGYDNIIKISSAMISVEDSEKETVWGSPVLDSIGSSSDYVFVYSPITGGTVRWVEDLTEVNRIKARINSSIEKLNTEKEYMEEQKRLEGERTGYEYKSSIYEDIGRAVKPELDLIENNISDKDKIPFCAVFGSLIKRRTNLLLLGQKNKYAALSELYLSVKETADYLKLYGIDTRIEMLDDYEPSKLVKAVRMVEAFDIFRLFLRKNIEDIEALMITISSEGDLLGFEFKAKGGSAS